MDDVPCKKNEFARRVGEIIDEDRFKLLTNLFFFPEALPWQKRREVLFDVAAVATDEEILASDARFAPLASALRGLTLDDYRKKLAAQRKAEQDAGRHPGAAGRVQEDHRRSLRNRLRRLGTAAGRGPGAPDSGPAGGGSGGARRRPDRSAKPARQHPQ